MKKIIYFCLFLCSCNSVVEEQESTIVEQLEVIENLENIEPIIFLDMYLAPKAYSRWVNQVVDNPLIKKKKIENINFELKYVPVSQMINNDLRKEKIHKQEFDSLYVEYSGMEYYELKLSIDNFNEEIIRYNLTEVNQYQERVKYLSFEMQKDIKLTQNNEVVDCDLFHFERTYGTAPHAKILLGFSKEKIQEGIKERTIEINDKLFNKGLLKYNWTSESLENIPKIKVI